MRKAASPILIFALLVAACFGFATWLEPRAIAWGGSRAQGNDFLTAMLGDGRRIFANHFFTEADVYFHSGYYPSIFDQAARPKDAAHMTEKHDEHEDHNSPGAHEEEEHEKAMAFMGPPTDWIDRFGRHFYVTEHSHLENGKEREILPWLRLSASLDPQRIETYTVAAFWLRSTLGKVQEAEDFLREGLRANPDSCEILFELGRLYNENYKDPTRARNLWELALKKWMDQKSDKSDKVVLYQYEQIVTQLARLEEDQGNYAKAAGYLEQILAHEATPSPDIIRKQIEELKQKAATSR